MASQWSGLAPAVNAHLHRWQKSDKEWQKIQTVLQRQLKTTPDGSLGITLTPEQHPLAYMWSVFARTWGLPTKQGGVVTLSNPSPAGASGGFGTGGINIVPPAPIVQADILATNGVVHALGGVPFP